MSARILHVLDHSIPLHSGYAFRTRAILEQQRRLGWETCHITSTKHYGTDRAEEDVDGFHFYRTFPGNGLLSRLPVLNQYAVVRDLSRRLYEVALKEQPDIIHAHSPCLNGLAAIKVGRALDIPVVYELRASWEDAAVDHGTTTEGSLRYRASRALESYVLKRVAAITTICEGLKGDILSRGIPEERVTVIPNAVDVERFSFGEAPDSALRSELGLDGCRVLGFIGSFYAYEGLTLLLQALPKVLAKMADVRLLLVGGGLQEEALQRLARELGIEDKVIFTGRVPHDQVQRYYNLVDVFVYPRLSMRLTELVTPLKPLEAMAQGRLVVASDVGGHKELIRDGETGQLFRAGSADDLARAVTELFNSPDSWPERRRAGRQFVEQERSWSVSVARYRPIYEALLEGRNG